MAEGKIEFPQRRKQKNWRNSISLTTKDAEKYSWMLFDGLKINNLLMSFALPSKLLVSGGEFFGNLPS